MIDLYRNRDFIPDFDHLVAETAERSHSLASRVIIRRDIAYGATSRTTLDLVFPDAPKAGAPLHMFVHGGYWRSGSKNDHTLVAAPVIAAGGIAAIVGYDLMPGTRLAAIVAQIRQACKFLARLAPEIGADAARFTASGHSAGAHLVSLLAATAPGDDSMAADTPDLQALLLVSGIYDLSDIPESFLKNEAQLRHDEAAAWSPLAACHRPGPLRILTRGDAETAPFHQQARAFGKLLLNAGLRSEVYEELDRNHLSIVLDLADPDRPLGRRLADLVAG
ncbi:alpha/beta hydrolase [Paracoccus liaowanqingii]|uniref:Alpha/beta hydrolase n=1 Tax=Paracoccus liaowanqingii TaxID=2560053 RepID=A0A4P7HL00_9RHOB|nr:alpha/beta hydrolase [Paracoccus liaowanqingii]QBX34303.1 alpha/beta hydrolase [Paracoccus liaowanqingii]